MDNKPYLSALHLVFKAENDGQLPATHGRFVQSAFLDLVRQHDPALSFMLHDCKPHKPYTLSGLRPEEAILKKTGPYIQVFKEQSFLVRFTDLQGDILSCLAAMPPKRHRLKVDNLFFGLDKVVVSDHPRCGQATYEDLYNFHLNGDIGSPMRGLGWRFLSATTIKDNKTKQHVATPEAWQIFPVLKDKWEQFSDIPLEDFPDAKDIEKLMPTEQCLRHSTHNLHFKKYSKRAFTGIWLYRAADTLPENTWRQFMLLASFSFYAGIGGETTRGLGQVQPLLDVQTPFPRTFFTQTSL